MMQGPKDPAKLKSELAAAGYKGEAVVLLAASDFPVISALALVGGDLLKKIGFNVDYQSLDWGTVVQRRASSEPIDKGGWNIFFTYGGGTGNVSPASLTVIRSNPGHGLVRLAGRSEDGGAAPCLVRRTGPGRAAEALRGHAGGAVREPILCAARACSISRRRSARTCTTSRRASRSSIACAALPDAACRRDRRRHRRRGQRRRTAARRPSRDDPGAGRAGRRTGGQLRQRHAAQSQFGHSDVVAGHLAEGAWLAGRSARPAGDPLAPSASAAAVARRGSCAPVRPRHASRRRHGRCGRCCSTRRNGIGGWRRKPALAS